MEAVPHGTSRATVTRLPEGVAETDRLAVEEPLEIRVDGTAVAVTMRTPGHDEELALGFCLTEGLHPAAAHPSADLAANVVEVDAPGADLATVQRSFYTSSSCGVCGKGALEAVAVDAARVDSDLTVPFDVVASLPGRLRSGQPAFDLTGGLHATGLFTADGELRCVREDVGRHNALDKIIGAQFNEDALPLHDKVVLLSGRASFELLQKALVARIPVIAAVGAPSSLAVSLAQEFNVTLCGFVRGDGFNVYTAPQRIEASR